MRKTVPSGGGGRRWLRAATSPLGIAWIVAAGMSAGLLGWLFATPATMSPSRTTIVGNERGDLGTSQSQEAASSLPEIGAASSESEQVEAQLRGLFDKLAAYRERTGTWPQGTAGSPSLSEGSRFSWLAVLASQSDPAGPQPRWDRAWNDPQNERFVRRRLDDFLNPAVKPKAGNDRYPASHFVGVTGFGPDSELLAADHPRAGVFGNDRVTAADDIPDGAANTMLAAGVNRRLGSWAAAGPSTLRGFEAEPYVNGPDGFSTGQSGGMFVLMADGSVKFLSSDVEPTVVRRMAAVADGTALNDSAPDVPVAVQQSLPQEDNAPEVIANDAPPTEKETEVDLAGDPFAIQDVVAEIAGGAEKPIEVPLFDETAGEDEGETVDVTAALQQPIAQFDQSTSVAAGDLLRLVEEMAAVTLGLERLPDELQPRLEQPVQIRLMETTVGEILSAVLSQIGLRYEIIDNRLSISERGEGA